MKHIAKRTKMRITPTLIFFIKNSPSKLNLTAKHFNNLLFNYNLSHIKLQRLFSSNQYINTTALHRQGTIPPWIYTNCRKHKLFPLKDCFYKKPYNCQLFHMIRRLSSSALHLMCYKNNKTYRLALYYKTGVAVSIMAIMICCTAIRNIIPRCF